MSKRQIRIFQTVADVQAIFTELGAKWEDSPILLSPDESVESPVELPLERIRNGRSFYVSARKFLSDLEFRPLPNGNGYLDTMNSPVVLVDVSKATDSALTSGSYLLETTRLVGPRDALSLVYKSEEFLRWGERLFRFIKSRSTRRDTHPGYRDWFLPEADNLVQNNRGHWDKQVHYVID